MCLFCVTGAAAERAGQPSPAAASFIVASFVHPVLYRVPQLGLTFYSYGVMVAAALAGFGVGSKAHLALSAFGAGEPLTWKAFDIRTGHSFIGSQIGAVLCMLAFIKYKKVHVLSFLDVLLPCCMLGHVIGKIGCFISGDGCYGPAADPQEVPWAMSFPNAAVPTRQPVHPTPIYESLISFGIFLAANLFISLPAAQPGRRTALVLVLYGFGRAVIEQYRRHPPISLFAGLTEYQVLALALLLVGVLIEFLGRLWFKEAAYSKKDESIPAATPSTPSKPAGKKKAEPVPGATPSAAAKSAGKKKVS